MTVHGGGDGQAVFNQGIISEWHDLQSDFAAFLSLVRLGDRLEMKREGYCHWAIFVGEQFIPVEDQDPPQLLCLPCVAHRANPTDNPDNFNSGFSSSSRSVSKGAYGIGDVCLEPLRDVWSRSKIRINNGLDNDTEPFPARIVVERVMNVVTGGDRQAFTAYNVVTNNCEHFASWARNGWALSYQVKSATTKILALSIVAAGAVLPRPLAMVSGIAITGFQMVREMRRT